MFLLPSVFHGSGGRRGPRTRPQQGPRIIARAVNIRFDLTDDDDPVPFPLLSPPCPRLRSVVLERAPLKTIGERFIDFSRLTTLHLVQDQCYASHASNDRLAAPPMLTELCIQSVSIHLDDEHMLLVSLSYLHSSTLFAISLVPPPSPSSSNQRILPISSGYAYKCATR